MDCCEVTPSKLNVLLTIEKKTSVADGQGGFTETWTADPVGGVWARVTSGSGGEGNEADRRGSNNFLTVLTRFRGDAYGAPYYTADLFRVKFRNRIYNITSVQDEDLQQRWLRMLIVEGDPS